MGLRHLRMIGAMGIIMLITVGCTSVTSITPQKIVLEADVKEEVSKQEKVNVTVEKINVPLPEGQYLKPYYWDGGRVYGAINKGMGMISDQDKIDYPISGIFKEHLYCLDENNDITQTQKQVFSLQHGDEIIARREGPIYDYGEFLEIDYRIQDEPVPVEGLEDKLKEKLENYDAMIDFRVKKKKLKTGEQYLTFNCYDLKEKKSKNYAYDIQQDKLYEIPGRVGTYIPCLERYITIEEDNKCYEFVLEENTIKKKEYRDLTPYLEREKVPTSRGIVAINEEAVLIFENRESDIKKVFPHEEGELSRISLFNLKTNEYQDLFVAEESQFIKMRTIGELGKEKNYTLILDTYNEDKYAIIPVKREFKQIQNDQLVEIFEEDITDEGRTISSYFDICVSPDKTQLFIRKDQTTLEEDGKYNIYGTATTIDVTYKKYTIE